MSADASPVFVNSWNEWDPLKRIIVGRAAGTVVQAPEPSVARDWPADGYPRGTYGPMPDEMVCRADEQLDNLVTILKSRGVIVDRPEPFDFNRHVSTPDWDLETMFGMMPPRDVLIAVGNEILEAPMSQRSRWHEFIVYRSLIESYFHSDKKMKWEAAPKPRLTDRSFDTSFWSEYPDLSNDQKIARVRKNKLILTEQEIMFDAADIVRLGRDLFVQLSMVTNRLGARWIRDHFRDHRVHIVTFGNHYPQHIDATLVPLRPGLVLHCGERPATQDMVDYFKSNDWDIVEAVQPARKKDDLPPLCFCSPWLSMNLLSVDKKTVIVEETEHAQMDQLDALGFEVIPVPFWDVAPFGGGLHCATVDIERDGALEDYFPKQPRSPLDTPV